MIYVFLILILIVCALLVLAILIQNPKGGGLGAGFGNVGNQVMGARRANDFIEKATWSLVAALLVLSLFSGIAIKKGSATTDAQIESNKVDEGIKNQTPSSPNPASKPAPGPGAPQPQTAPPAGGN